MRMPVRVSVALLGPLVLAGCVAQKVNQDLAKSAGTREAEFKGLLAQIETRPRHPIGWKDARQRMRRDNLGLQQSRLMLERSERQTRRQWMSLIPRMSAFLNISKGLTALTEIDSDDLNASLVASFNIPNPFDFYGTLYGIALQTQNSRWSQELDERRAFADLYSAFLDAKSLRQEETALERRRERFSGMVSGEVSTTFDSLVRETDSLERRRMSHRQNVNRLLNTPGGNWDLTGEIPDISYRSRYRDLNIGRDFGQMALNLFAVRIESAIMQTQRVKFRQWPIISFGMSNPPLYSNTGTSEFNAEDVRLFSGATKSIDVTDVGGREAVQDAERRLKFTRAQLRQNMEREAVRMLQLRKSYDQLLSQERRLMNSMRRYERPATSEAEAVLRDLELRSQIELQLIQVRWQIKQLDLQYLIWDERFWKS